jgi:hypothetical protein
MTGIQKHLTSRGFLASFQDFDLIFLLSVLNELFSISDTLFEILQKKAMDINYCLWKVTEFKDVINNKRTEFGHTKEPATNFHQKENEQAILT